VTPQRAPWHRATAAYAAQQRAADADELALLAHDVATQRLARAWQRFGQATGADIDAAAHEIVAAERDWSRIHRHTRAEEIERAPQMDEPARFAHPWRTIGIGCGAGAALALAWAWGSAGLHGLIAAGAIAGAVALAAKAVRAR